MKKKVINWKKYNEELLANEKTEQEILNEYREELHTMKMKDELRECHLCQAYKRVVKENEEFDKTNQDFFNYEKEIGIGKTN